MVSPMTPQQNQPAALTGPGPRMGNLPTWQNQIPDSTALTSPYPPAGPPPPAIGTTPGAGAGGYTRLPDADIYRRSQAMPGFGPENPNRVPGPGQIAGTTDYAIPGAVGLGGGPAQAQFQGLPIPGGTVSFYGEPVTARMSQADATAYNVGKLNSQIEALRSLREAQNPGITTGQAARAFGDLVSVGTPGGNFSDEAMQAEQARSLMEQSANPRSGMTNRQRQAAMQAGMGLATNQVPGVTRLPAMGGGAAIDPYKMGQLTVAQQKLALDQQRFGLDQNQAAMTQQKNQFDANNQVLQRQTDAFVKLPQGERQKRLSQMEAALIKASEQGTTSPEYVRLMELYRHFANLKQDQPDYMNPTAKP